VQRNVVLGSLWGALVMTVVTVAVAEALRRRWYNRATPLRFEDIQLNEESTAAFLGQGAQGVVVTGVWRGGAVAVKRLIDPVSCVCVCGLLFLDVFWWG
jgi:hypothetical protein